MILIGNTNFEFELEGKYDSLERSLTQSNILLQLQYLPLLFAENEDWIAVSDLPINFHKLPFWKDKQLPKFILFKECGKLKGEEISSWGASLSVREFAEKNELIFSMPKWETVEEVNSKAYTFTHCKPLQGSALLHTFDEAVAWLRHQERGVLKSCFGVSGRGHFFFDGDEGKLKLFLENEFLKGCPVIAEPWVERVFDFSTQWKIEPDGAIHYLGDTRLENTWGGSYLGTVVGKIENPFLEEHKSHALELLMQVSDLGYFGFVGLDAFVYKDEGLPKLHPIVEMNARRTLGLAALLFQQKYFPDQTVRLQFSKGLDQPNSLLPQHFNNRKAIARTLTFSIL